MDKKVDFTRISNIIRHFYPSLPQAKVLTHNPEIYGQFSQFSLKPPASTKEVMQIIDGLKSQQVLLMLFR